MRIDPPVSLPTAPRHMPAATAAAEPPLLPPGMQLKSHGLRVGGVTVPKPNSCVFVLPKSTVPAAARARTTGASALGTQSDRIGEPAVVGMSLVATRSLTATGTPSSIRSSPPCRRASDAAASANARS